MATPASPHARKKGMANIANLVKLAFDGKTITKIANDRKKCGLIISNSANVPEWMANDDLSTNVIKKGAKPVIFDQSPLKGTFTDGFAMYSTFSDVKNFDVKFAINIDGTECTNAIREMFLKTQDNVTDFFIYYSGIGKSYNGDWLSYDEKDDKLDILTLSAIVKLWKLRANKTKNQYLLIISDTNYSGIWVQKAIDRKLFRKENILIQSSVGRFTNSLSLEMTMGQIKPPCWITEITCGKFTFCWLDICSSQFYKKSSDIVLDMIGGFVVLNKELIWDNNDEYYDIAADPMSNIIQNDQKTIICIPCYGYNNKQVNNIFGLNDDLDDDYTLDLDDLDNVLNEIDNDINSGDDHAFNYNYNGNNNDNDNDDDKKQDNNPSNTLQVSNNNNKNNKNNKKKQNVKFVSLSKGNKGNKGNKKKNVQPRKRSSHLPQPSTRRLGLLQGIIGGIHLRKHKKKKTRHISTYGREFIFTKVLNDIRHMVHGSDDDDDDDQNNADWIDD